MIKRSFPAVADANTRLFVLGSLPGEKSLAAARYYAHPQNQFWRLLGVALGADLAALDYDARLETLLAHHVGLWDVVGAARREGSLDGAIRDHQANDIAALTAAYPRLHVIAFNGGKASMLGRRNLSDASLTLIDLPSSSPAYTIPFAAKAARWATLAKFLD